MTEESPSTNPKQEALDLSGLTDFQFGPAWARQDARTERSVTYPEHRGSERPRGDRRPRRDGRDNRRTGGERRPDGEQGEKRFPREDRKGSFRGRRNDDRKNRPAPAPQAEPTEGVRVELRPVDSGLAALHQEIMKHRRTISLMDLAKVVMSAFERYDLVFMKQENGPDFFLSKQGDGACFITKQEAVKHIWQAEWFGKLYVAEEQAVEAPKGNFTAIAKCSLNGELIGPVNWHGYQSALMNLHRTKYANMPFEAFRAKVVTDKSEEAVAAWQDSVSKRTVWKPVRDNAADTVLESAAAVEQDFETAHFNECFEVTDKVFINGAIKKSFVSPGLWSHIVQLSSTTRHHPSMLIPNLCHGLARHHMPIFKWQGNHFTGPARPKSMVEGTVLSDTLTSIINWAKDNHGKTVDIMLKELAPVPAADAATEEEIAKAQEMHQALVRDLLWLSEQGYILVFSNNTLSRPKVTAAQTAPDKPAKEEAKPAAKTKKKKPAAKSATKSSTAKAKKSAATKQEQTEKEAPAEPAEQPVAEAPAEEAPDPQQETPAEPATDAPAPAAE